MRFRQRKLLFSAQLRATQLSAAQLNAAQRGSAQRSAAQRSSAHFCRPGVDASAWQDYVGGVLTSTSCSSAALDLDHAIQLVGFNADDSELPPCWIVRNSWSSDWGEDGYIYLAMDGANTCGLVNAAATVTLA